MPVTVSTRRLLPPPSKVKGRVANGGSGSDRPDLLVRRLEPGDLVLLATDGLHAVVDPSTLAETLTAGTLTAGTKHPAALVEQLIGLALTAGGPDNVGVALAQV